MWWLYVAVAMPLRGVSMFICWRANERPLAVCGRGAHSFRRTPRALGSRGRLAYAVRVCSLLPRAVKRGADACAVGGDACAAALDGEVGVFCFPTVACGVVGEERGAQVTVKHDVQ